MIIQGQNEGQKGGRAVRWAKGGEEKLICDHDAALANGQDTREQTNPGTTIFNIRLLTRLTIS